MYFPELLNGLVDLHLHVGPSLIDRRVDSAEMAQLALDAGYRAIVIKDHHSLTAPTAAMIKKHVFKDKPIEIFGSTVLNSSNGGLNPYAVKSAIGFGAKIVWLPTVGSYYHIMGYRTSGHVFPKTMVDLAERPILLVDGSDRLLPEVVEILEIIAQYPDVTLATGHISTTEINAVVEKAHELGIKRIMIDHPTYIVGGTVEQCKYWASLGAYIEFIACLYAHKSNLKCLPIEEASDVIKENQSILGFADDVAIEKHNLRLLDSLEYAKAETLEAKLEEIFG